MIDPLQALKSLFADRPEVVAMFDRRELDLQALTDARLVDRYRQRGLYPEPVNLYVTGRTGAGKSTLGNRFLTNSPLPSTGRMDCTDKVQFFRLASNLVYLDLPGSGASDAYENINRAALLVEQLSYKPTDVIPMIDFSDVHATGQDPKSIPLVSVPLARWRSDEFRQQFESDVILYVVAPHMQWLRPDRDYARDLLQARKEATGTANVIFALNLFRGVGGAPMSTPENIADVRQKIREVWQEVLEGEPTILDVNSRTGQGLHDLAEAMCRLVPAHKIGNMGQSLTQELRDAASAERARRFHGMLVSIAARLATFKVDATLGHDDLLRVALTAICSYALDVFYGEAIIQEAQQDLVRVARETTLSAAIDSTAATTRQNREQAIKISVQDVIEEAETVERITGYEPRIENVEEEEEVTVYKPETVTMEREALVQFGASLAEGLVHSVVAPLGAIQSLFGAKRTVHDDISDVFKGAYAYTEQRLKQETETVTRFRQKIVGFEEQKEMVTRMVPRVVVREQEVGRQALAGGAAVVEDVLAFGMAIEGLKPGSDLAAEFDRAVEKTRADVRAKLKPIADRIDSLATSHDVVAGERQLLSMLNPLFVA